MSQPYEALAKCIREDLREYREFSARVAELADKMESHDLVRLVRLEVGKSVIGQHVVYREVTLVVAVRGEGPFQAVVPKETRTALLALASQLAAEYDVTRVVIGCRAHMDVSPVGIDGYMMQLDMSL